MEFQLTPQMIEEIDSRVENPIATHARVLVLIKTALPDLTTADLIMFSSHFLVTSFSPESDYGKMAKALLANVYYLHYMSEVKDGLQHPTRERNKDDGVVETPVGESRTNPDDRDSNAGEVPVQVEPSASVSGEVKHPSVREVTQ